MKIRVWYEYPDLAEAVAPRTMDILKKYNVSVGMAFPDGSMNAGYANVLRTWHEQGIETALWVLLPDEFGYWPNERNVVEYSDYVKRIFDWAERESFSLPWIAVDLEPPIYQMKRVKEEKVLVAARNLLDIARQNRDMGRFYEASRRFEALNEFIHARGARTVCPITSTIVQDILTGGTVFQDLMETPVSTVNWDLLSVMIYTSMFVGYSRGMIRPKDARWYLYTVMRDLKERYWERAGVSLGVTYIGKLGDEPYYKTPDELLPDFEAVKAALNFEGILRSAQPEVWFETLFTAEPRIPERSFRVDAFRALSRGVGRLL